MSGPQDWRPLVQALEAYIDTTQDRSPLAYLSHRYPTAASTHGAALEGIAALLRQAESLAQTALAAPHDSAPIPHVAPINVTCAPDGRWLQVV
ncbi:hypothetical protein U5801_21290 [Lamprobacter modestohalophilus]|uniref:hypothetical protein n=1 Tax=Lamprobacter modestohalophilus TaxID=1064514 RepID=UPI002ADEC16E|nr:hypothetical protein [Lamprobacter modestohalophilus]MEA1052319.1 hypothetical protein [Lamprobacter modestohalophilus]